MKDDSKLQNFDANEVYDEKIRPLMTVLISICQAHKIPMLAQFCVENNNETESSCFISTSLPIEGRTPSIMYTKMAILKENTPIIGGIVIKGPKPEGGDLH